MVKVFINLNDEIGEDLFSVALMDNKEYWIDSFKTKKEALKFIKSNKYIYKEKDFVDTRYPYKNNWKSNNENR